MPSSSDIPTLARLVRDHKGDRSYADLERDCGGHPTAKRLQQIATTDRTKAFPDPPTVEGLSRGLGVSVTTIVLSAAAGLGLNVRTPGAGGELILDGVDELSRETRNVLLALARQLVRLERAVVGGRVHDAGSRPEPDIRVEDLDLAARGRTGGGGRVTEQVRHLDDEDAPAQ